jgi:hypothetical protein
MFICQIFTSDIKEFHFHKRDFGERGTHRNQRGLPTMVYPTLFSFSRHFACFEFYSSSGESHRWKEARSSITLGNRIFFSDDDYYTEENPKYHYKSLLS